MSCHVRRASLRYIHVTSRGSSPVRVRSLSSVRAARRADHRLSSRVPVGRYPAPSAVKVTERFRGRDVTLRDAPPRGEKK